jgi:hypothetical protein
LADLHANSGFAGPLVRIRPILIVAARWTASLQGRPRWCSRFDGATLSQPRHRCEIPRLLGFLCVIFATMSRHRAAISRYSIAPSCDLLYPTDELSISAGSLQRCLPSCWTIRARCILHRTPWAAFPLPTRQEARPMASRAAGSQPLLRTKTSRAPGIPRQSPRRSAIGVQATSGRVRCILSCILCVSRLCLLRVCSAQLPIRNSHAACTLGRSASQHRSTPLLVASRHVPPLTQTRHVSGGNERWRCIARLLPPAGLPAIRGTVLRAAAAPIRPASCRGN